MIDPIYTPEEVATLLKVHVQTVREWLRAKRLKGKRVGDLWRIPERNVKAFMEVI